MPKSKEYNDQETLKLDETFKETLIRVRSYILELTSAETAELCKVWLDKLNNATSQRRLRNEYLLELCRQLRTGRIEGIFSSIPPKELLPLPKSYHMVCISSSHSDQSACAVRPVRSCLKDRTKSSHYQKSKSLIKHRALDNTSISHFLDSPNITSTVHCYNYNEIKKNQLKIYEQRISTLNTIIGELQTQNEYLKKQLLEYSEHCSNNVDKNFYTSISQLTSDVIMLKAKLLEMQKMKNSREENYREVIQQYHSTVVKQCSALKDELDEVRVMNESFDNRVVTIDVKLAEIIHGKDEQAKQIEKQCMEKMNALRDQFEKFILERNKELEMKQTLLEKKDFQLSQKDAGRKEDMELLTNKIYELEMKLEMKNNDEEKLQATLIEQYRNMKEEFSKLKSDVDYEIQQQNENLMSKVSELNKTVLKLEKSKQKLGYDYEKKMLHIIQNKDSKIKSLQLQLQEQKNELCRSLTTKQQSEVDNIVTLLEKRYRTLLAETEATTECQTQEYLKKIAALEDLVLSMQKH